MKAVKQPTRGAPASLMPSFVSAVGFSRTTVFITPLRQPEGTASAALSSASAAFVALFHSSLIGLSAVAAAAAGETRPLPPPQASAPVPTASLNPPSGHDRRSAAGALQLGAGCAHSPSAAVRGAARPF